uniref:hypothetical protein n=1 Tax=uncultured Caulobacter sp. TaxID=158749 RepID=UPI0025CED335|nr:hypothetical protein [uncultured Caulobacter sp.]
MAYTLKQLTMAWTAAHGGVAPDATTLADLGNRAAQNAAGVMTDAQVLGFVLNSADNSTALAALSYQFFTGKSPTQQGLAYLTNSPDNPNDLNDPYYGKFNTENRYINFAANLGVAGEGKDVFAGKYGAMTFADYVASIYETIIGGTFAKAAGVDPAKAVADIVSRQAAILATAQASGMITPGMSQAQIDLALKAATAGYLLGEAIKADIGLYAAAANNFTLALVKGEAVYNTDITATYKPTPDQGVGSPVTTAPAEADVPGYAPPPPPPSPPAPQPFSFTLTSGGDAFTGAGLDDTFTSTPAAFNANDVLDGGAGNDTLTISGAFNGNYTPAAATFRNIETVNVTNTLSGVYLDSSGWTGVTKLNITAKDSMLNTAGATQDVTVTNTSQTRSTFAFNGGHDVTISIADSEGTIRVGTTTAATGAVVFSRTRSVTSQGTVTITGGTSLDVTLVAANAVNTTQSGAASLYGSELTTSIRIKGSAARTADTNTAGHYGDNFYVYDYYRGASAFVSTITTVEANGFSGLYFDGNALTTLKASNGGNITINNDIGSVSVSTTLDAMLDNTDGYLRDAGAVSTLNLTVKANGVTADLQMAALTALTIDGTGDTRLNNSGSTALTLVDASALTGDLAWTPVAQSGAITIKTGTGANSIDARNITGVVTFEGGAGNDTLYTQNNVNNVIHLGGGNNYFSGYGGATSTITAGAGNDTLWVNNGGVTVNAGDGNNQVHAGAGDMTIITGTGDDEISISGGTNTVDVGSGDDTVIIGSVDANGATQFASITGMGVGDTLNLFNVSNTSTLGAEVTGQTTLADYLNAAAAGSGSQANSLLRWFVMGGDLYIVSDASNFVGFDEGRDVVVKLVGSAGLATGLRAGQVDVVDAAITFL